MTTLVQFRAIVEANQDRVYAAAMRVLGDREDALDVMQDTFLALHLNHASVPEHALARWLERVATNAAIDRFRKRMRRRSRQSDTCGPPPAPEEPGPGPVAVASESEERQLMLDELQRLPDRQRQVVTLRVVDRMTFAEICQSLGISDGAAKTHFRRGVQALTSRLESHASGSHRSGKSS